MNSNQNEKHEQNGELGLSHLDDEKNVTQILNFNDFLSYMREGLDIHGETSAFEKQMKYLFDGIDLNGLSYVNLSDVEFLLLCHYQKDQLNIAKIFLWS